MTEEKPRWKGAKPVEPWVPPEDLHKPLFNYKRNASAIRGNPVSRYFKDDGSGDYVDLLFDGSIDFNCYVLCYYDKDDRKLGEEYIHEHSVHYAEDACENWALGIKQVDFGHKV